MIIILNEATIKEDSPRHGLLTVQDFQGCFRINEDYNLLLYIKRIWKRQLAYTVEEEKMLHLGYATFEITCKTILALPVAREKSTRDWRISIYLHEIEKCRRE